MTRTHRHLVYSLLWLLGFVLIVIVASSFWHITDAGQNQFRAQVGSLIWVLGFAAIFFSWARLDAVAHGKPKGAAVLFAAMWPWLIFVAHIAYLFYTRGLRSGFIAALKFVSFLLASAMGLLLLGKLAYAVFG